MLQDIFNIIEESYGSQRPLSLKLVYAYCVVGMLVIWLKNLVVFSVKLRFIRNNLMWVNHLVPEFIAQSTDCELSPSDVDVSLGIYCNKLNVFRSVLDSILEKKNNVSIMKMLLPNGGLLKLNNERSKQNLSWSWVKFCCFKPCWWWCCTYLIRLSSTPRFFFKKAKKKN